MRDEQLLHAMADLWREGDPLAHPLWEKVAAGTAHPRELAFLETLFEDGLEFEQTRTLFEPLDAAVYGRLETAVANAGSLGMKDVTTPNRGEESVKRRPSP